MKNYTPEFEEILERVCVEVGTRGYIKALEAIELGLEWHTGLRKDNVTPEYQHQLEMAEVAMEILPTGDLLEKVLLTIFLHDICEDYDYPLEKIEEQFGSEIKEYVWLITDEYNGVEKTKEEYYSSQENNLVVSISKGIDNDHNLGTMGVFKPAKKVKYLKVSEEFIIPMLKTAKENFNDYVSIYNILIKRLEDKVDGWRQKSVN